MPSNAELSAHLLRNAAEFFRNVGEQNEPIREQMEANARTYEMVAEWVESDPTGEPPLSDEGGNGKD